MTSSSCRNIGRNSESRKSKVKYHGRLVANDVAIRSLGRCANPPFILNVAGPLVRVRDIAEKIGQRMGKAVRFDAESSQTAIMADDGRCLELFGAYRDTIDQMLDAAARWVEQGGENWGKPTMFDRVDGGY